ncbi:hypothetical protein [Streptococcus pneumoniae]|uniref:hypothetical protein n=1 Tax=Streptococcus pneumoniae TaxID=1313 RepID=UPI001156696C|nr:hypothetical protein [Streptococcus pneumoniae]
MKIKEQTRKLTLGCSKYNGLKLEQCTSNSKTLLEFDFAVLIDLSCSYFILIYSFEVVDKEKLMWFEEVFEECKKILVS